MLDYESLIGLVLRKTQDDDSRVALTFTSTTGAKGRTLRFQGLLLKTSSFTSDSRVVDVRFSSLVGFRGFTALQRKGLDAHEFRQLTIVLREKPNSEGKNELICVSKRFEWGS